MHQSAVPWRRPRDFLAQSTVVGAPQSGIHGTPTTPLVRELSSLSGPDQTQETLEPASPAIDSRNMFQRYGFQFGSIGNFGRATTSRSDVSGDVNSVATPTGTPGSGSWGKQAPCASTAPVAVFHFQDFDDMVARMREQTAPQTSGEFTTAIEIIVRLYPL